MTLIFNEGFAINSQGGSGGSSMPSNVSEELTWTSSGQKFTAPANGWFVATCTSAGSNSYLTCEDNGEPYQVTSGAPSGYVMGLLVPVRKGVQRTFSFGTATIEKMRFFYAVSSQGEAPSNNE